MPKTIRWATLCSVTAVVMLAGCTGPADSPEPDGSPESTNSPAPASTDYLLAEELGYLPALEPGEAVHVQAADYERVGELLGRPKPTGPDATVTELTDWATAATVGGAESHQALGAMVPDGLAWRSFLARTDEIEAGLGVSFRGVLRYVENIAPPDSTTVLQGEYDPAAIDAALGPAENGVWVFGEEFVSNPQHMTVSPPVGAGLSMGESGDGRLLLSRREAAVRGIQQGGSPTLADDPALRTIAETLDAHGWYSAMLLAGQDFARSSAEPAFEPFVAIGATVDVVDGEGVIRIAYAHTDAGIAAANEELVTDVIADGQMHDGTPYAERFHLAGTSVHDAVLLVTLAPQDTSVGIIWTMLAQQESLVAHG